MVFNGLHQFVMGFSCYGDYFGRLREREAEYQAGHSFFFIALSQYHQVSSLVSLVSILANKTLSSAMKSHIGKISNLIVLLNVPIFIVIASINAGAYISLAEIINARTRISLLPTSVNPHVAVICKFIADHGSKIISAAMFAACVAFYRLGDRLLVAGIASGVIYQMLDSKNIIPFKISLFVERYSCIIRLPLQLQDGLLKTRIFVALELPICFPHRINQLCHYRLDSFVRWIFKSWMPCYRLEEFDRSIELRKQLSFNEIRAVLTRAENSPDSFEIDPAHCNKPAFNLSHLPRCDRYDRLLEMWDEHNWYTESTISTIKLKILSDEKFVDNVLCCHFSERASKDQVLDQREYYFNLLMDEHFGNPSDEIQIQEKKRRIDEYVINWTREQLNSLVLALKGEIPCAKRVDLVEAQEQISYLIPYLDSLGTSLNRLLDFENGLLKLAVEAGSYCGLAKKRASRELITAELMKTPPLQHVDEDEDVQNIQTIQPSGQYENQLREALQQKRLSLVHGFYNLNTANLPDAIKLDEHGFDSGSGNELSRGFLHQSIYQIEKSDLLDTLIWEMLEFHRYWMFNIYFQSLTDVFYELGRINFSDYLINLINENSSLSKDQKADLINGFENIAFERDFDTWCRKQKSFDYLVLYMLGVIRTKTPLVVLGEEVGPVA